MKQNKVKQVLLCLSAIFIIVFEQGINAEQARYNNLIDYTLNQYPGYSLAFFVVTDSYRDPSDEMIDILGIKMPARAEEGKYIAIPKSQLRSIPTTIKKAPIYVQAKKEDNPKSEIEDDNYEKQESYFNEIKELLNAPDGSG
jgi:hypothetical protein